MNELGEHVAPPEDSIGLTWSQDAVRTAEQVRSRVKHRPAAVLIGGLEDQSIAGQLAREVSHALAELGDEQVLFIDTHADHPGIGPSEEIWQERVIRLTSKLHLISLSRESKSRTDNPAFIVPIIEFLELMRSKYPLLIIHCPLCFDESYALVARSTFTIVVLTKGRSAMRDLEKLYSHVKTISSKPLGVVLSASKSRSR